MWRERKHFKKKVLSSLLAALLVLTSAFSSLGSITVYAAKHEEENTSKAGMAYRYMEKEDVQISVLAENENFAAGEDVHLRVFVMNNTQETLSGGILRFDRSNGSGIQDGRFEITDGSGELSVDEDETTETEESAENIDPEETEEGTEETETGEQAERLASDIESTDSTEEVTEENWEDMDEPEEEHGDPQILLNGRRILNITLEPGESFEAEFFGAVNPELERITNRNINFYFRAKKEDGYVSGTGKFEYNTGVTTMLPVEFDNGGELLTNEENTMYLHTIVNDAELASLFSGPSFGGGSDDLVVIPGTEDEDTKATSSNASKATDSNAVKATSSDAGKEETEPAGRTETETSAEADVETTVKQESTENAASSISSTEERVTDEAGESGAAESEDTERADESASETEKISESYVESAASEDESRETEESNIEGTESEAEESKAEESAAQEARYSAMVLEDSAAESADYSFEAESSASEEKNENSGSSAADRQTETEPEDTRASETETSGDSTTAADHEESAEVSSEEVTDTSKDETGETTTSGGAQVTDSVEDETEEEENPPAIEGFDIKDISYEITTYGVRLRGVSVDTQMVRSSNAELVTAVGFRVADKTAPGLYFGTATMVIKYNKKTYKTSTGFQFYVTGEGEVMLKGSIDGAEIQVKGPAESFPDSEELELMVSEVPEDKAEMVAAALEKKAQEEGITVDRMKAVDLKILADGEEKELTGEVTVTFQQMKLERLDGAEDKEESAAAEESASEGSSAESESTEETPQEEQTAEEETAEEETIAPVRARRAAARRAVQPVEEETAESEEEIPVTPVVDTAEETEESESAAESKEEHKLAVWHLDEEALELNDMGGNVDENGDVVMITDHFSIYLVVNVPNNVKEVPVIVEHYAKVNQWELIETTPVFADPSVIDEETKIIKVHPVDISKDDVVKIKVPRETLVDNRLYPGTPEGQTSYNNEKEEKIYSDDVTTIPNGAGTGISYEVAVSKWSKVSAGGNYEVESVTITNEKYPYGETITIGEEVEYIEDGIVKKGTKVTITKRHLNEETGKIEEKNNDDISTDANPAQLEFAATNNVIKIVYKPTTDNEIKGYADFHDYNVAIGTGVYIKKDDEKVNTENVGINNLNIGDINGKNYDPKDRIYFGIGSSYGHSQLKTTGGHPNIVAAENVNIDGSGQQRVIPVRKNIPEDNLVDKQIKFNYYDPGLFVTNDVMIGEQKENKPVNYYAKKYLPGYQLGFKREGDRYTLDKVRNEKGEEVSTDLSKIRKSYDDGKNKKLYSNLFWPLDKVEYGEKGKDRDYLYGNGSHGLGLNDELSSVIKDPALVELSKDGHNWFFGMRFDVEFTLGDYIGDMNYYFRGDDDLWLFVDGKRVKEVDLGGIHSSQGAYVDFRDWMEEDTNKELFYTRDDAGNLVLDKKKKHTMSVFFIERGGSGSCCYMSFTLPGAVPVPSPGAETISKTVNKNWIDGNNVDKQRPQFILVQLQQNGEDYGNAVKLDSSTNWQHTWEYLPKFKEIQLDPNGKNEEHVYTIKEISTPPGYSSSTVGFKITNTLIRDVKVHKRWGDDDNADHTRPGSIQVQLYKKIEGEEKEKVGDPVSLNNENEWSNTWPDKPIYDSANRRIHYSVEEVNADWLKLEGETSGWYEVSYPVDQENEFEIEIVNTYVPEYTTAKVTKVWSDENNKYGLQPESIEVQLLKNGEVQNDKTATLNKDNGWSYTWEQLPKYTYTNNSGTVIQTLNTYTIKEVPNYTNANYYVASYSEPTAANEIVITNTLLTAKFRIAKRIDNYQAMLDGPEKLDFNDLLKDEFIINVKEDEGGRNFSTGIVLKHAANSDRDVPNSGKVSKYIKVPVTKDGILYHISEIVPKEYTPSSEFLTIISNKDESGQNELATLEGTTFKNAKVRVRPGADAIVIVHNNFTHQDYFHDDASVDNDFSKPPDESRSAQTEAADTDKPAGKSTSRSRGGSFPIEPEPVSMLSLLPGEVLLVEREEEEELEEDDRLL